MAAVQPVPAYLGRVVNGAGEPAGTCFQVAPGVLVTAWHVLDNLGSAAVDEVVTVGPLVGGDVFPAAVRGLDDVHDLAVLGSGGTGLAASVPGFAASEEVLIGTGVVATGVAMVPPDQTVARLDAPGSWAGSVLWEREVPVCRVMSSDVMPGMSGAPVRRVDGDVVVGVVSGRYNSADGWLRDSVWVARVEDLETLLAGAAAVEVERTSVTKQVALRLAVDEEAVRVRSPRGEVTAAHRGVSLGLARRIDEVRQRRGFAVRTVVDEQAAVPGMSELSRLMAEAFLAEPVAGELAWAIDGAATVHERVVLGVEAPGAWSGLPWEALAAPGGGRPLALCPLVDVYRAQRTRAEAGLGRPMRILVAIASPETGGGELLDYEGEMRSIVSAVRAARQARADVRFVPFASTTEIHTALKQGPVHVLHVSGHGRPGALVLEDEQGNARMVDADTFVEEAIPAGRMPPVVALAACHTDALGDGDGDLGSFAAHLAGKGPVAVIATEASVTDAYATRLFARIYGELATADRPDVVAAVCEARRLVQRELEGSTVERDRRLAGFDEWATVTVLASGPAVLTFDDAATPGVAGAGVVRVGEVLGRGPGEFVGRRREQRRWPTQLLATDTAGMVLFGMGGVGKTTLATELARRVLEREPTWESVGLSGFVSADRLLSAVCSRLRMVAATRNLGEIADAVEVAARPDLPAADRLGVLRERVFPSVPVLVLLDNFEDNLGDPGSDSRRPLRDEALASLLAGWIEDPGQTRLLFTSRYPIDLPGGRHPGLVEHQVGPMSLAETRKLMWALPRLDALDVRQVEQVWRMLGGHPRSLEYLDALLAGGRGRFPDVTARLTDALENRLGTAGAEAFLQPGTELQAALTETVALVADDVLVDGLVAQIDRAPGARRFLIGVSTYRRPGDRNALLFQVGDPDDSAAVIPDRKTANEAIDAILAEVGTNRPIDPANLDPEVLAQLAPHLAVLDTRPAPPLRPPDELQTWVEACQAASLLDVADNGLYSVHRWTATLLSDRHATSNDLDHAHRQAAAYWQWHYNTWPQDHHADAADLAEVRHHHLARGDLNAANQATEALCLLLHQIGAWDDEAATITDTLTWLPNDHPRRPAHYHHLGILAQARGDYADAESRYRQSLTILERLGDQAAMATSYHQLGTLAHARGDYADAESRYRQSLTIRERLDDQAGMATSYHQLGMLAQARGDYADAESRYRQSLTILERLGDQARMATSYHQLGMLAQARGDYEEAESRYRQSFTISERLGNQASMAKSHGQLGNLAYLRRDYEEAESRYRQSLTIDERLGNQAGMATSYLNLGVLAQARGDYEEAESRYRQSVTIYERLGDQAGMATSYSAIGSLAADRNDLAQAIGWHVNALAIRLRLQDPRIASNLGQLSKIRAALPRHDFDQQARKAVGEDSFTKLHEFLDNFENDAQNTDPQEG